MKSFCLVLWFGPTGGDNPKIEVAAFDGEFQLNFHRSTLPLPPVANAKMEKVDGGPEETIDLPYSRHRRFSSILDGFVRTGQLRKRL